MSVSKYVKLGELASFFHDPVSGLTVSKGDVVGITNAQASSKKIRLALNGGHLVLTDEEGTTGPDQGKAAVNQIPEQERLVDKLNLLIKEEASEEAIKKAFNLDQLKSICEWFEIEPEANDTKSDLVTVILAEAKK